MGSDQPRLRPLRHVRSAHRHHCPLKTSSQDGLCLKTRSFALSSSLGGWWPGELVDVIAFPPAESVAQPGARMRYYEAVPVDYIPELLEGEAGKDTPYMT